MKEKCVTLYSVDPNAKKIETSNKFLYNLLKWFMGPGEGSFLFVVYFMMLFQ
jgi:hypothetical protein